MFSRFAATCAVVVVLAAGSVGAQEWARKMFETSDHDFGTVARGADVIYKFPIKNIYKEDIHIQSVRSSCGCTDPSLENDTLKTYDVGYVVAKFNTRTFTGVHSATLTVEIDKPYRAQVQLRVHGNIRGDVVFEPGSLQFDTVPQGEAAERRVSVKYAGRPGWSVKDVVVATEASDMFAVELSEVERNGGRVVYDLLVRVKPEAKAGYLQNQLVLVTNDGNNPRIPLDVEGVIVPAISAQPDNLVYGELAPGETVSKKIVIRGQKPFRITGVDCGSAPLKFDYTDDEKTTHIVNVTFTAPTEAGKWKQPIRVSTSLGESFTATLSAFATVAAPAEEPAAEVTADGDSTGSATESTATGLASGQ